MTERRRHSKSQRSRSALLIEELYKTTRSHEDAIDTLNERMRSRELAAKIVTKLRLVEGVLGWNQNRQIRQNSTEFVQIRSLLIRGQVLSQTRRRNESQTEGHRH